MQRFANGTTSFNPVSDSSTLELTAKHGTLKILAVDTVTLNIPQLNSGGDSALASTQVTHDFGFIPTVIAFITVPSGQAPGADYTRFFGTGQLGVARSGTTISILSSLQEEVISTATTITFNISWEWAAGFSQAAATVSIKYLVVQEAIPDIPV